ncbi:DUF4157 domain-containing protein [Marivirga sp. S37H4]|uniref:DUF4157 domain-containing protein n=1 Tax=Marivirga aurantiaca TaxID=2802615 RepID=A0A934WXR5_9BACT|nr:DUF4157 domain-containing protein [Marivirga aurantiaca]MBK6265094.1 DUF4157 domain-containing protein [Marivirga aurantiaca]
MNTHADKIQENKSQPVSASVSQMQGSSESTFQFVDNRPEAIAQRKLQEVADNSPQTMQLRALQAMADHYSAQQQHPIQKKENNTGLPDNLKSGVESLSGYSMDDVKVHYNSDKPAQLNAHAYAKGTDIHLASGQEKHLPHEAWHVVQQKQGRVKPTTQLKGKVNVNDDAGLEKEADVMGAKALSFNGATTNSEESKSISSNNVSLVQMVKSISEVVPPGRISTPQQSLTRYNSYLQSEVNGIANQGLLQGWQIAAQLQILTNATQMINAMNPPTSERIKEVHNLFDQVKQFIVAQQTPPIINLAITYGAAHGDLHFIANPTANKSAWTIPKVNALALMNTEITNRMQDIVRAARASQNGQVALLLIADSNGPIGNSIRNNRIQRFQIQLQADLNSGGISYHGFPDDQALHTGLGATRNSLV